MNLKVGFAAVIGNCAGIGGAVREGVKRTIERCAIAAEDQFFDLPLVPGPIKVLEGEGPLMHAPLPRIAYISSSSRAQEGR